VPEYIPKKIFVSALQKLCDRGGREMVDGAHLPHLIFGDGKRLGQMFQRRALYEIL